MLALLSLLVRCARAQVLQVSGGNSSAYQAGGGSLEIHAPSYNLSLGAGMVAGRFEAGAKLLKSVGPTTYITGDDQIDFHLPTDIFDSSHYLFGRGAGLKTTRGGTDAFAFAGTTSTLYETPIFEGAKGGEGLGFLSLRKTISPQWQVFSESVFSGQVSQIMAVQWEPVRKLDLAMSGGVGANQPYGAASMKLSRHWIDLQGSYIDAGQAFHRVIVPSPMLAEPDKGNVLTTFKPTGFLTLSAGEQHYLVPQYPSNVNVGSSVRQGSASVHGAGVSVSGTVYDSAYQGQSTLAAVFTLSHSVTSRVHFFDSYLASRPKGFPSTSNFVSTISEDVNAHVTMTENVSTSNGQPSVLFGGTLLMNLVSVSANYETFYVPARSTNPFEESLVLDLQIHLFGRMNLHGASFVGPTGHLLYTADASGMVLREEETPQAIEHSSLGASMMRGRVIDTAGHPIEGATLLVDTVPVFTSSDGRFFLRERRPHIHKLSVVTDQFLCGGQWDVVSSPNTIKSSRQETPETLVVVSQRVSSERTGESTH